MTYTDESSSLAETDLDVLSRTKPKEANELVTSDQAQDKLEEASDTSMPTNGSGSLENKAYWQLRYSTNKIGYKISIYFTSIMLCYNGYQGASEDFYFSMFLLSLFQYLHVIVCCL